MSHDNPPAHHSQPGPSPQPPAVRPAGRAGAAAPRNTTATFVASVDRHLLFEQLSTDDLALLDTISWIRDCQPGETIFRSGAPASHIYVNLEGAVYLLFAGHSSGERPLLSEVLSGEIFGVSSVVGNRRYTTDAVAAQTCRVLSIEAQPFLHVLRNNPQAGMRFAQGVARVYMDRYLDLMRHLS